MKFLLDHDVYAVTLRFLKGKAHDAVSVAALGLTEAADEDLLRTAQDAVQAELERVLQAYSEDELMKAVVVIEADGHRIRKVSIPEEK